MEPTLSPIHDLASSVGASFTQWQGWELPSSFGDAASEYRAAKQAAALYDSTYLGRLKATGTDVLDLLNRLSTNLVDSIEEGSGVQTVLTDDRGRILDLLVVLNVGSHVLLITGPQNRDRIIQWIDKYTIVDDVTIEDVTLSTAMLSVLGPGAGPLLSRLTGVEIESLQPYHWMEATVGGKEIQIFCRDGIGMPRYEAVTAWEDVPAVWQALKDAGALPIGTDAHEALRVEAGVPGYSSELIDIYNPLEAGLWNSISFNKGCYIGQEVIARLDTYGKVQRHLVSVSFPPDAQIVDGLKLAYAGKEVGSITSIARLPETGDLLGLSYIRKEAAVPGTMVTFGEGQGLEAQVVALAPGSQPQSQS